MEKIVEAFLGEKEEMICELKKIPHESLTRENCLELFYFDCLKENPDFKISRYENASKEEKFNHARKMDELFDKMILEETLTVEDKKIISVKFGALQLDRLKRILEFLKITERSFIDVNLDMIDEENFILASGTKFECVPVKLDLSCSCLKILYGNLLRIKASIDEIVIGEKFYIVATVEEINVGDCERGVQHFLSDQNGVNFFVKLSSNSGSFYNIIARGKKLILKNLFWDGSLRNYDNDDDDFYAHEDLKLVKTIDDETTFALY